MNKTWMPRAAGVLDIISGTLQVLVALFVILNFVLDPGSGLAYGYSVVMLWIGSPCLITGILAIAGGIYVIQKKKWSIVYLGALAAFVPLIIPSLFLYGLEGNPIWWCIMLIGIAALVLSLRAEKEFKK